MILWSRDIAQLEVLRDEIKHLSPNVLVQIQRVDVTSEEDVVGAFAKAKEAFGMIDVAIFNSGVNTETTKVGDEATTIEGRWRHFVSRGHPLLSAQTCKLLTAHLVSRKYT